ncbi:MAG TPA: trehalose-6-phosphate synthase [Candidatus Paceibacterota bacterium]|nr:trehalose-6-phosphate synthase [Candidatus Paceibacterota bacterium]
MRQLVLITGGVLAAIALIVMGLTFTQANKEELALTSRLQSRTQVIADSLAESIEPFYGSRATTSIEKVVERTTSNERLAGLGVFDNAASPVIVSDGVPEEAILTPLIERVMDSDEAEGAFVTSGGQTLYVFVNPMHDEERVVGALLVLQNAQYINDTVWGIWRDNFLRLLLVGLLFIGAVFLLAHFVFIRPLSRLAESVKDARKNGMQTGTLEGGESFFEPLSSEISKIAQSLQRARSVASEEARLRLEKLDTPWTAERLKEFFKAHLKGRQIFVVSNREPYIHTKEKGGAAWQVPASGMVTALEPVMEACGGMWIAHGSGSADKETVDAEDKIAVPPDEPKYTLKRVWLGEEEVRRYYNGFSNEALWPLCLLAHNRPLFREPDWRMYRQVNGTFAQSLLAEAGNVDRPMVLVQDFHLALLPRMVKNSRPDAEVGLFWHIPWPSAEKFSICPWRKEILDGMLGADLIGFHTQQHCLNFMDTVSKEIECIVNFEEFSITRGNHTTHVKPFPISIAFNSGAKKASAALPEKYGVRTQLVGIGVDRMDYTKGILEKLKGLEFFFSLHPEYQEKFTFIQIAPSSREGVAKYREFAEEVAAETRRVNQQFERNGWKPVVLIKENLTHEEIHGLYAAAQVCLITSLSDGMNLVAKEYVAARNDEAGVLVVSQFAGASRELKGGAIILNPYSAEETAESLRQALAMPLSEQYRRMKKMRGVVQTHNIFRWAAEFLRALSDLG